MKPFDESFLTAFLDDELSPGERKSVEDHMAADPALAIRLSELRQARNLVSGLGRPPAAFDFSATIMALIEQRAQFQKRKRRIVAGAIGLTASLTAAASFLIVMRLPDNPIRPAQMKIIPKIPKEPIARRVVPQPTPGVPLPSMRPSPALQPSATAIAARIGPERLRSWLKSPEVREIVVRVDTLGPSEISRFDEAIEKSNRRIPRHARLRLVQNIADAPSGAGPSVVYALVMDDVERDLLREKIRDLFPESPQSEQPVSPDLMARLDEVGRIDFVGGLARASLTEPPPHLKTETGIKRPSEVRSQEKIVPLDPRAAHPAGAPNLPTHRPLIADRSPAAKAKPTGSPNPTEPVGPPRLSPFEEEAGGGRPFSVYVVCMVATSGQP